MPRTLLVVEDEETCAAMLEIALGELPGVAVKWLRTAEEALVHLSQEAVCALVTDLHLPEMDGFKLIEQVRREPLLAGLPVIAVSGDSDPHTPARVLALGADAYFVKPYSPAEVRSKVEQLIHAV
ncbi:MAG: response regulator [Bryobacteraceae bacterium]